ncbi:MAG: hypothetical protein ACPG7F_00505 [Aggregatilineales bacterium]
MRNITIERNGKAVNHEWLHEELQGQLSDVVIGTSGRQHHIVIHLVDSATPAQEVQAQQILANHDANQKTTEQQKRDAANQAVATLKAAAASFDPVTAATRLNELNAELGGVVDGDAAENLNATQIVANFHQAVKRIERLELITLYLLSELWRDE